MTSLACRPRDLIEAHLIILPVSAALGWVRRFNWCSLSLSFLTSFQIQNHGVVDVITRAQFTRARAY